MVNKSKNIVNIGYTDKLSYFNYEKVKLYIDSTVTVTNELIYIQNINGDIVKKIYTKLENQIYRGGGYDIYHYKYGLYSNPCVDFVLDITCEIDIEEFEPGIYIINDKIVFIVKENINSNIRSPICCLISTNTISMYNVFGGKNSYYNFRNYNTEIKNVEKQKEYLNKEKDTHLMYNLIIRNNEKNEKERSKIMKINLPLNLFSFFNKNYGLLKFLFNSNYKVNYITDLDLHNNIYNAYWDNGCGNKLNLFIISGHSEYWSLESRKNFDIINKNGTNILNLSGNSLWSRIKYSKNNIIHQRYNKDYNYIPEEFKESIDKTYYFCYQDYPSFDSIGVDYLYGGHNYPKNKYFNFDKENKLISDIDELNLNDVNGEFDGFETKFNITDQKKIHNIINNPEKIKDYKYLFTLSKKYNKYKYKQILMYGCSPTYNYNKKNTYYFMKSTGIIALKENENTGVIINCGYSSFCSDWKLNSVSLPLFSDLDNISIWEESKKKIIDIFIKTLLKKKINFNKSFKNNICSVCDKIMIDPLENRYCNNCGSVERHRFLINSIKKNNICKYLLNEPVLIISEGKRECNKYYESAYYFNKICKIDTLDIREYGGTCFKDTQYFDYVKNCEDLSFMEDNKYKAIVLNHVLSSIKNDLTALSEFNRILKNDGILIVTESVTTNDETILFDCSSSTMCCRLYGKDFTKILLRFFDNYKVFNEYDSLTEKNDNCYFFFKNNKNITPIEGSSTQYKKNKSYLQ